METFFIYFLKVNGLLISFFFVYYFLLRKETFFNKNRWFLILGLVASLLLPLITFTKTIWIEPIPVVYKTAFIENSPITLTNQVVETPFDWSIFLVFVYGMLVLFFLAKMLVELFSFFRIIKVGSRLKLNETILIDSSYNTNPFSFFNYIVYNSKLFNEEELQHIISHENIHVKEKHSIDVLLVKLFCALFWINPISWLYNKEMLQNLEYIADSKASSVAKNRINYQKTLVKVVTNQHQLSITNQFYQSLIKKRIVMLNTNQSNQRKSWKYALILPVLSAFMLLFQIETVAQVKEQVAEKTNYAVSSNYSSTITKNTTDAELKELEETFSNENRKLVISDVKRNKKGEINEIKLLFDTGKTYHRVLHRKSNESINDIQIFVKTDDKGNENCNFIETDEELAAFIETSDKEAYSVEFESSSYVFFDNDSYSYRESIIKKVLDENVKYLLFFNDKEISKNEASKIKGNLIEEIIEISPNGSSISKYGEKGKNGVVLINSKKFSNNSKNISISWDEAKKISEEKKEANNKEEFKVTSEFSETENHIQIEKIKNNKNIDYKKALIIYDGNEIKFYELNQIDESTIASSSVMTATKYALDKYGDKGKNGVIELKSQKYLEKVDPVYNEILSKYKERREVEINVKQNSNLSDEEIETRFIEREKLIEERKKILEEKKSKRKIELEKRKAKYEERKEKLER
jgi:hypothetical protein